MIYRILAGFFCFFCFITEAQVVRDINYNYLYDPGATFTLYWKVVKVNEGYKVFHQLQQTDTTQNSEISLQLETRASVSEKSGKIILNSSPVRKSTSSPAIVDFQAEEDQRIVVAKVTVADQGKTKVYLFYKHLPKTKSAYLMADQKMVIHPFTQINKSLTFFGFDENKQLQISYYDDSFPAAAPAFSTAQAKVSVTIKPDSIFSLNSEAISFTEKGLYLVQQDTSSAEGLSFRVEEDYPKLGKLESLAGPLIYICTKQEFEKLKAAGNDKKKFDQIILTITGNAERARSFMRSYFKRVELANQYFSSYKEGWKTDRGMLYIIFGLPEEVYLFEDREVWEYKNETMKERFQFIKSPTLFDPNNFVLIRDKKFTTTWYEIVDLWRKARF
jgi:GWxTD domain-containing protein